MQSSIKTFAVANNLSAGTRSQLYSKLAELRRPSLVPRILSLAERCGVDLASLWRTDYATRLKNVSDRLGEAYARRSLLMHTGSINDSCESQGDQLRVHALTELLIVNLLGGSAEWLGPFSQLSLSQHGQFGRPRRGSADRDGDD